MAMIDYSEKRDFLRMNMECPARFRVDGEAELQTAVVKDLSGGGLSLMSPTSVAAESRLAVEVMPGKSITPPLSAWVKVIRCDKADDEGYLLACAIERVLDESEVGPDFP